MTHKNPHHRGQRLFFAQTPRLREKPKNILTYPVRHPQTTPRDGPHKKAGCDPTRRNEGPRHEVEEQPIQRMQAQEKSWTERRFFSKHQNNKITTNKKQQRIPYSLKHIPSKWNKRVLVDKRNPPKINKELWKDISQRPPRGKQNEILVISIVFHFKCAQGGEKKKLMMRKRGKRTKTTTARTIKRDTRKDEGNIEIRITHVIKRRKHKRRKISTRRIRIITRTRRQITK